MGITPRIPGESRGKRPSNMIKVDTSGATAPLVTLLRNALPGSDRDHVWPTEGLEACRNTLRQMTKGNAVSHCSRCYPFIQVMKPDPKAQTHPN